MNRACAVQVTRRIKPVAVQFQVREPVGQTGPHRPDPTAVNEASFSLDA
jgi:hypothetical protein